MFLKALLARNPALVEAVIDLHRKDAVPPGTFCLDLEAVEGNASLVAEAAADYGIRLFFMTKQIGRNPAISAAVLPHIPSAVAVDMDDADCLTRDRIPLGHVGHLVQPHRSAIPRLLAYEPEFITVFSLAKALEISVAARAQGRTQSLLVRVADEADEFFPGQEGGIPLSDLESAWATIDGTSNVRVAGVTSYPTVKFVDGQYMPTRNLETLGRAVEVLGGVDQVNAAGHTSVDVMPLIAAVGATQAEPGHALTGTTPLGASGDSAEVPAACFLSEVSHIGTEDVHVFGGGFYARDHADQGVVDSAAGRQLLPLIPLGPTAIDYYRRLQGPGGGIVVGDPVIFAFRFQVFTSRARVAVIDRVQSGDPRVVGIWDCYGAPAVGTSKKTMGDAIFSPPTSS